MNCTRSRDAEHVKATAAFIENGRAYLVLAIGAGLLIPLAVHALADPVLVAAAVYEATGRCLLVPAGGWSTHLRQILVCGRAAA
ncbi:MAG: hypothetical protein CMJ58_17695 [Planctomycetaceae bacterium]|nr:hypothetical protein [Planctomycetaceae bacterium]